LQQQMQMQQMQQMQQLQAMGLPPQQIQLHLQQLQMQQMQQMQQLQMQQQLQQAQLQQQAQMQAGQVQAAGTMPGQMPAQVPGQAIPGQAPGQMPGAQVPGQVAGQMPQQQAPLSAAQLAQMLQIPETDASVKMVAELEALVKIAEMAATALAQMTERATKDDKLTPDAGKNLIEQVDIGVADVNTKINASRQFMQLRRPDMEKDKNPQQTNLLRNELAKMAHRVQAAQQMAAATAQVARDRVSKGSSVAQQQQPPLQDEHAVFKKYDQDGDGFLNRAEILAFCRGELRLEVPQALCDAIIPSLVVKDEAGLRPEQLPRLRATLAAVQQQQQALQGAGSVVVGAPPPPLAVGAGGLPRPPGAAV